MDATSHLLLIEGELARQKKSIFLLKLLLCFALLILLIFIYFAHSISGSNNIHLKNARNSMDISADGITLTYEDGRRVLIRASPIDPSDFPANGLLLSTCGLMTLRNGNAQVTMTSCDVGPGIALSDSDGKTRMEIGVSKVFNVKTRDNIVTSPGNINIYDKDGNVCWKADAR